MKTKLGTEHSSKTDAHRSMGPDEMLLMMLRDSADVAARPL